MGIGQSITSPARPSTVEGDPADDPDKPPWPPSPLSRNKSPLLRNGLFGPLVDFTL